MLEWLNSIQWILWNLKIRHWKQFVLKKGNNDVLSGCYSLNINELLPSKKKVAFDNLLHSRVDCCIQYGCLPCNWNYPDNSLDVTISRHELMLLPSRTLNQNEKFEMFRNKHVLNRLKSAHEQTLDKIYQLLF